MWNHNFGIMYIVLKVKEIRFLLCKYTESNNICKCNNYKFSSYNFEDTTVSLVSSLYCRFIVIWPTSRKSGNFFDKIRLLAHEVCQVRQCHSVEKKALVTLTAYYILLQLFIMLKIQNLTIVIIQFINVLISHNI